jgi:hypothetical protein
MANGTSVGRNPECWNEGEDLHLPGAMSLLQLDRRPGVSPAHGQPSCTPRTA